MTLPLHDLMPVWQSDGCTVDDGDGDISWLSASDMVSTKL